LTVIRKKRVFAGAVHTRIQEFVERIASDGSRFPEAIAGDNDPWVNAGLAKLRTNRGARNERGEVSNCHEKGDTRVIIDAAEAKYLWTTTVSALHEEA
jgi:hypothetical protein